MQRGEGYKREADILHEKKSLKRKTIEQTANVNSNAVIYNIYIYI